jgi:hypothetical protein
MWVRMAGLVMILSRKSDLGARLHKQWRIYLYHGSEDDTAPFGHVDLYEKAIPQAVVHRLTDRDHQLNNDMSESPPTFAGWSD